jgi:Fe2+ or Zn2+ uptake regulation protein
LNRLSRLSKLSFSCDITSANQHHPPFEQVNYQVAPALFYSVAHNHVKNPAPPTVYRALDFLLEQGLVHKLESLHAYVGCAHPDHPHASQFLICGDCGEVAEVENPSVAKSLKAAGKAVGFRTKRPVVELLGTCAQCIAKQDEHA